MKTNLIISLFIALFLYSCEWKSDVDDQILNKLGTGHGIVTYTDYEPLKAKPINLHFYIPEGDIKTMPIVFILPGTGRNANDYLAAWMKNFKSKEIIAIALEFPQEDYSTSEYIEGNMFKKNEALPEEQWSFSVIEAIFSYVKAETGNQVTQYSLFGHSAGAQFVHRFVTFKQNLHLNKAVAANAGWYTVPNIQIEYPYGLKNSGYTDDTTLSHLFGSNLIVALGDQDIDPNDNSLRHDEQSDAQGLYRYARGEYYYSEGERISKDNNMVFNWKKVIVKGVAHDFEAMMVQTINYLL